MLPRCFLVAAALRALLDGAEDHTFLAALAPPTKDAPNLDALYALVKNKLKPPRNADAPRAAAWRRRGDLLATFLLDPRAADLVPGGHEKKKKTKRRD